jgi:hypothetical protein
MEAGTCPSLLRRFPKAVIFTTTHQVCEHSASRLFCFLFNFNGDESATPFASIQGLISQSGTWE